MEILILLKVCLFPVLLKVPVTVHPLWVTNETGTPFVHFLFLGVQLGKTFVISLQSFSREKDMAHLNFTFPHLTWTALTVSSTAREEHMVTKRKRAKPKSLIFSEIGTWIQTL